MELAWMGAKGVVKECRWNDILCQRELTIDVDIRIMQGQPARRREREQRIVEPDFDFKECGQDAWISRLDVDRRERSRTGTTECLQGHRD